MEGIALDSMLSDVSITSRGWQAACGGLLCAGQERMQPVSNDAVNRTRHESRLVDDAAASDAAERLLMTEKLISELNQTWEEKIRKSEEIRRQR